MNNNKSSQLTGFDMWAALAYYGLNQENQHPIFITMKNWIYKLSDFPQRSKAFYSFGSKIAFQHNV